MAKQLQLRKGTATEHNTFTGANGEVTVDTTNKTLRVHDGTTAGGTQLATLTGGLVPAVQLPAATTITQGAVILNNTLTSTSTTQALTAAQGKVLKDAVDAASLGVGQTWQDVTASRANGVTYTNSTGKTIQLLINAIFGTGSITLNGLKINIENGIAYGFINVAIPNTHTYRVDFAWLVSWSELR